MPPKIIPGSKNLHRIHHGLDARDFVSAEQISFAERGEDSEEWFGAADFFAEKFKGVGQRMAHRKAKFAEPEGIEEGGHLVADTDGAVLKIAIVKAQAGIEEDFLHAVALGGFNLAGKEIT